MILSLEFGLNVTPIIMPWNRLLDDFPKVIKKDGKYWEWVMYSHLTNSALIDYELKFGELNHYSSAWYSRAVEWDEISGFKPIKCECGSKKVNGDTARHAYWCDMWKKY